MLEQKQLQNRSKTSELEEQQKQLQNNFTPHNQFYKNCQT